MKLQVSLTEDSIDAAIERLEQAKDNLRNSLEPMTRILGQTIMATAEQYVHVQSGDLKENLMENLMDLEVEESPEFVFTTYAIADVEAHTRKGWWREHHRKAMWMGEHYAAKENARGDRHAFMDKGVQEAEAALPSFIQAVEL